MPHENGGADPPQRSSIRREMDKSCCSSIMSGSNLRPDIGGACRTSFIADSEATIRRPRKNGEAECPCESEPR